MCQHTSFFAKFLNKCDDDSKFCIGIFIVWFILYDAIFYVVALCTFYGLEILTHIGYDLNTGCPKDDPMCGGGDKMVCYNDNMTLCYSVGALIGMGLWASVFFSYLLCVQCYLLSKNIVSNPLIRLLTRKLVYMIFHPMHEMKQLNNLHIKKS